MRHTTQTIGAVVQMRNDGFTLGEIVFKTGLSKTTIFHHIRSIPKSGILIQKIKAIRLAKQKTITDQRRGKSVKNYRFLKPNTWDSDFVKLTAHFLFDGTIGRSGCVYYNRNQVLRDLIIRTMSKKLNVRDYKIYNATGGVKRVCYFNVELASFIRSKADELLEYIVDASKEHKISFLRAFFDDEGCVTFSSKKRIIRGYQHSLPMLKLIKKLLDAFKIESKIDEKYYELYISGKGNLFKFKRFIGFTPGVRVNGKRSNSIWKKNLEKRQILQMAINSYL